MKECKMCLCSKHKKNNCCRYCDQNKSCTISDGLCRLTFIDTEVECMYEINPQKNTLE